MHGLDLPGAGDVDGRERPAGRRAHRHALAVGRSCGVLDQFAASVDPRGVVGVRLVGLQQREFRVVAEVDALVAKRPTELEHALHTADEKPLEVQLRRDAQIQVEVVGVDVSEKRARVGAAVYLLQHRSLDLEKTLAQQRFSDCTQHLAACRDEVARLAVDRQVDVAGTDTGLWVGEALPLVRQRSQALADQPPVGHDQRARAVLAVSHRADDFDEVAEVDRRGEVGRRPAIER